LPRHFSRREALYGLVGAAATGCLHRPPLPVRQEIVFGRLPSLGGAAAEAEVEGLARYLEAALRRPVRVVTPATYPETFQALERLDFDLAFLGAIAFVRAERLGYEAAAVLLRRGTRLQRGLIFTSEDSDIHRLADLPHRKVAFVDEASSTGFQFPAVLLERVGVPIASLDAHFLNGHDAVVRSVLVERAFDAGACYEGAIEVALHSTPDRGPPPQARVLARTDQLPHAIYAVPTGHPLGPAIRQALLGVERAPDAKSILEPMQGSGFALPDEQELQPARRVEQAVSRLKLAIPKG
jgi:phosphonate transport system substrate-binding protein